MAGPVPPPSLPANPTQFQVDAHQRQEQAFAAKLTADHRALARALASRLSAWAATTTDTMSNDRRRHRERIRPATRHLGGNQLLHQPPAGRAEPRHPPRDGDLRRRRPAEQHAAQRAACPESPSSSPDFQGSQRAQAEWQADLLQAGAARAIVLVPAAADELAQVTRQALAGQDWPSPSSTSTSASTRQACNPPPATHSAMSPSSSPRPIEAPRSPSSASPTRSAARRAMLSSPPTGRRPCKAFLVARGSGCRAHLRRRLRNRPPSRPEPGRRQHPTLRQARNHRHQSNGLEATNQ